MTKDAYLALENIVGPEHITQDVAILETYNQMWGNKLVFGSKWSTRPGAVVMPGCTEEVQAIVRVCNRYKITFKPFSSGFEIVATALLTENSILIDLRRMDRILEIDVKNMQAVVEPYVSQYRLNIELQKYGLISNPIASGPSTGVVASTCSHFGGSTSQNFTGGLGRNLLGAEWVLPTGDIMKMGSMETGASGFSCDGPGPSMRGVLRGQSGANGGHGVITKCSVKLYPWYGPPKVEFGGSPFPSLRYPVNGIENFKLFRLRFPTIDNRWEAFRELGQAEIAFTLMQEANILVGEGNDQLWEMVQKTPPKDPDDDEKSILALICAPTKRSMEYRVKCLEKIVEKYGGCIPPELNDSQITNMLLTNAIWGFCMVRTAFRATGEFFVSPCTDGTNDMLKEFRRRGRALTAEYIQKGHVAMGDAFITAFENSSIGSHVENVYLYDPYDEESCTGVRELAGKTIDPKGQFAQYGVPLLGGGLQIEPVQHVVEYWGPHYDNYHLWMAKIKAMLDPNNLGDWSAYCPPIFP
nr:MULTISPECIES: FAD-binding oxidoreductase [Clostridium]